LKPVFIVPIILGSRSADDSQEAGSTSEIDETNGNECPLDSLGMEDINQVGTCFDRTFKYIHSYRIQDK
jgi:hypothetical protein